MTAKNLLFSKSTISKLKKKKKRFYTNLLEKANISILRII